MKPNLLGHQLARDPYLMSVIRSLVVLGARLPVFRKLGVFEEHQDGTVTRVLQDLIDACFDEYPYIRRQNASSRNVKFLLTPEERYHASVIHAISQRINLAETIASNRYLEALATIYTTYLDCFGLLAHEAPLNFNDMVEVITGVKVGNILVETCSDCAIEYLSNPLRPPVKRCYFCAAHAHPKFSLKIVEEQQKLLMNA